MNLSKLEKIINVFILLSLLLLLIFLNVYKTDPCQKCELELEGKPVKIQEFWNAFEKQCLVAEDVYYESSNGLFNFSSMLG